MGNSYDNTITAIETAMLTLVARHSPYADRCFNKLDDALQEARCDKRFSETAPVQLVEGLDTPSVGEDNMPDDVFQYPHIQALLNNLEQRGK